MKNKMLVVLGPTATGKTEVAVYLAKKFNGELVASDSRQVYRGLDIGTGKLPGQGGWKVIKEKSNWEIDGVKVWLYDVVGLKKHYSVAYYIRDAAKMVDDISNRRKLPILVGGTGLYLQAFTNGLSNLVAPVDEKLRRQLNKLELNQLQKKLQILSATRWERLNQSDRQNKRRLIRYIELLSMNPYIDTKKRWLGFRENFDILKIGLIAPRSVLYQKINDRVLTWLEDGIVEEVKNLVKDGVSKKRLKEVGLEYGVVVDYLDGKISKEQLISRMQTVTRQYAKRQLTWFKKETNVVWFDITKKRYFPEIENLIMRWYHYHWKG